jgi:uncharacterized SAM-binding protein YcdF (DUF218 family)
VSFIAAKLAEILLRPSTILLAAGIAGFLLVLSRRLARRRTGVAVLAVTLAAQLAIATLPVDIWTLSPLEDRFPPLRPLPPAATITGIVVLGGAVDQTISEARGLPSLNDAAERMTEFVHLALLYPDAVLAFTGGSGRILNGHLSEADVARALFDQLGLANRQITYENRSRTTWENAIDLARLLHPQPGQRWILITSATHMPRAVGAFRANGWSVLPDPVGYKTAHTLAVALSGTYPVRLFRLEEAAHEWQGLLAYRLLGHTTQILPRPE